LHSSDAQPCGAHAPCPALLSIAFPTVLSAGSQLIELQIWLQIWPLPCAVSYEQDTLPKAKKARGKQNRLATARAVPWGLNAARHCQEDVVAARLGFGAVYFVGHWRRGRAQTAPQSRREKSLSCQPTVIVPGGKLTLHFAMPHPAELAVVAPDGTYFFPVYDPDTSAPGLRPLVDKPSFRPMSDLQLDVSGATGSPWVSGRTSNEPIFRLPGKYRFVLTDILETDAAENVSRCMVTLKRGK